MADERAFRALTTRRQFLGAVSGAGAVVCLPFSRAAAATAASPRLSAEEALAQLRAGNRRFVSGTLLHPRRDDARRALQAEKQTPFAAVLGCSDSRVPPEVVFDQGIGDLFIVRDAGNVIDPVALGSLEYAVEHLHVPLILVLGNERCGAVAAAVESAKSGKMPDPHIDSLVEAIAPAVTRAQSERGDLLENAVHENVRLAVARLKASPPLLAPMVRRRKLHVVGGLYRLASGSVEWL